MNTLVTKKKKTLSLQVLELTDVALDDSMLGALGGCLSSARPAATCQAFVGGGGEGVGAGGGMGHGKGAYGPAADAAATAMAAVASGLAGGTGARSGSGIVSLRTLILGHCGGVSETAFETFLALAGGGGGGAGGSRVGTKGVRGQGDGGGKCSGGGGRGDAAGGGAPRMALSCVRLQGCKALGDRGLVLLCAGAKGRLSEVQVGEKRLVIGGAFCRARNI